MNNREFKKALSKRLYPILRAEGFTGSGSTLRRIVEPVVHVFNVQGSGSGDGCYLNLGAHLTFVPPEGGLPVAAEKMEESHCAFRGRFEPPSGPSTGWYYGSNVDEMNESIAFIVDHWTIYGQGFFAQYSGYPDTFRERVLTQPPRHARECRTFARIAIELGEHRRAAELIEQGLDTCSERATLLIKELMELGIENERWIT